MPVVSVVIPLYNKGPYIARALNSIFTQTFQDFEVIVVDDGSTDDGAAVVRGFEDPRIRLIQQENQGVSAARNRGITASRYNFIALLDADDEWSQNHLEILIDLSLKYPTCALFSTSCSRVENYKKQTFEIKGIPKPPWDGIIINYFTIIAKNGSTLLTSSSVGIKKDAILSIGGFPLGIKQFEDECVWGKIALRYNIAFSWNGEVKYHSVKGSASDQLLPIKEHPFINYAKNNLSTETLSPSIVRDLERYIITLYIEVGCRNIRCRNYHYALVNLRSCGWHIFEPRNIYLIICSLILLVIR
ncbi:glycosyltransferase family 2 protein [Methanosphaerula subterraneus]|uniref:glycosyltransferase family 2 protein n=1 Tax=Methanosphaerula subterraneus TaxID=3350244 RepID=UPI003F8609FF